VWSDGGEVVDGGQESGTTELWVSSNTGGGDTEEAGGKDGLDDSAGFEVTFDSALLGEAGDEGHDRLGDGVGVVLDLLVVVVFVLEDHELEEGEEGNEDLRGVNNRTSEEILPWPIRIRREGSCGSFLVHRRSGNRRGKRGAYRVGST
jgi:hypothetical protein